MYSCLAELRKPSYHILLNPRFILSVYVMMWTFLWSPFGRQGVDTLTECAAVFRKNQTQA